jgi:hypothetical protein
MGLPLTPWARVFFSLASRHRAHDVWMDVLWYRRDRRQVQIRMLAVGGMYVIALINKRRFA